MKNRKDAHIILIYYIKFYTIIFLFLISIWIIHLQNKKKYISNKFNGFL